MSNLELRPSKTEDLPWLDSMHPRCMREHVEKHYKWNPYLFSKNFKAEDYTIIQLDGNDIGFVKLIDESKQLYLADMMVSPEHQGCGIGRKIIDHVIAQGRPIRLQVLTSNRARYLYQRKGFKIT